MVGGGGRGEVLAGLWLLSLTVAAPEGSETTDDVCCTKWSPGHAESLAPWSCWASSGVEESKQWSLTILTRPPMQQIFFRGQQQEQPAYQPPLPVDKRLCDGSQTGGGQCHYGVTRSYLRGLQLIGHERFTFNPPNASLYGDVIWALGGAGACAAATDAKRSRHPGDTFVVIGPNIQDLTGCGLNSAPDAVIVPSWWVKRLALSGKLPGFGSILADYPADRILISHAGVDTEFWKPSAPWPSHKRHRIVLYDKSVVSEGSISRSFVGDVEDILLAFGRPFDVVSYGFETDGYDAEDFRAILDESIVAVFLSRSESQGLALAEAWAMDVPTLVWQGPKPWIADSAGVDADIAHDEAVVESDAAPYLTDQTGLRFSSLDQLPTLLAKVDEAHMRGISKASLDEASGSEPMRAAGRTMGGGTGLPRFQPREWVLRHMSDEAAALYALHRIGRARAGDYAEGASDGLQGESQPDGRSPSFQPGLPSRRARLMEWRRRHEMEGAGVGR